MGNSVSHASRKMKWIVRKPYISFSSLLRMIPTKRSKCIQLWRHVTKSFLHFHYCQCRAATTGTTTTTTATTRTTRQKSTMNDRTKTKTVVIEKKRRRRENPLKYYWNWMEWTSGKDIVNNRQSRDIARARTPHTRTSCHHRCVHIQSLHWWAIEQLRRSARLSSVFTRVRIQNDLLKMIKWFSILELFFSPREKK